jgi:hypothetical protein
VVRIAQKHEQGTRGNQEQAGMPGKESWAILIFILKTEY